MANTNINHSKYYVTIRESELPPYYQLLKLSEEIYNRGLQEGWIPADLHADFITNKDASIDRIDERLIQKEAARRLFSRLSILIIDKYDYKQLKDRITPKEYVTLMELIKKLDQFMRDELHFGLTRMIL